MPSEIVIFILTELRFSPQGLTQDFTHNPDLSRELFPESVKSNFNISGNQVVTLTEKSLNV